jgi:beta-glucanase (GH16 family)
MQVEFPINQPNLDELLHPEFFDRDLVVEPFVDPTADIEEIQRPPRQYKVLKALATTAFLGAVIGGSYDAVTTTADLNAEHNTPVAIVRPTTTTTLGQPNKTSTPTRNTVTKPSTKPPVTETIQPLINTDPLFSTKPKWVQDYASMPDGPVSSSIWNVQTGNGVEGWGNNEAEYYTDNPANLRVENGALIIEARHQSYDGYNYTSARIDTEGKESFEYGEISIVAEVPGNAPGDWFAAWMLSENNKYENLSPTSDPLRWKNDGEMDIMEGIGNNPFYVYDVVHTLDAHGLGHAVIKDESTAYNTYSVKWTPDSITFLVNGQPTYEDLKKPGETYKEYPFNQPYYLVLNLAMGGTWGSGDPADKSLYGKNGIKNSDLPAKMKIQSIAYYPYVGPKK